MLKNRALGTLPPGWALWAGSMIAAACGGGNDGTTNLSEGAPGEASDDSTGGAACMHENPLVCSIPGGWTLEEIWHGRRTPGEGGELEDCIQSCSENMSPVVTIDATRPDCTPPSISGCEPGHPQHERGDACLGNLGSTAYNEMVLSGTRLSAWWVEDPVTEANPYPCRTWAIDGEVLESGNRIILRIWGPPGNGRDAAPFTTEFSEKYWRKMR